MSCVRYADYRLICHVCLYANGLTFDWIYLLIQRIPEMREQNEMNPFISYPEPKLILCKDNARRKENEMNHSFLIPSRSLSYAKITQGERRMKWIHSCLIPSRSLSYAKIMQIIYKQKDFVELFVFLSWYVTRILGPWLCLDLLFLLEVIHSKTSTSSTKQTNKH